MLFRICRIGDDFGYASTELIALTNALIVVLKLPSINDDQRQLWLLKTMDFIVGILATLPRDSFQNLDSDELKALLQKYLRSMHRIVSTPYTHSSTLNVILTTNLNLQFRLTSLSISYNLSTALGESMRDICGTCLEIELMNFGTAEGLSHTSSMQLKMENLIKVAGQADFKVVCC